MKCQNCKAYKPKYNDKQDYVYCRGTTPVTVEHECKGYVPTKKESKDAHTK